MEIEKAFKKLLVQKPFYGIFCLSLPKSITTNIDTLAVSKKGLYMELLINPDFWNTLTDDEQLAVLQHELSHIALQHMFMNDYFDDHELLNICADLEVNSYIDNLPKDALRASMFGLQDGLGVKAYYEALKGKIDTSKLGLLDDHGNWKEFDKLPDATKQLIQNNINTLLKNTAEQVAKSRGTIPSEFSEIIQKLLEPKPEIFNWKAYFKRLLGNIYDVNIRMTRRKPSKRFDDAMGIKHRKRVSILVAVDTSGSVYTEELQDFFNEIDYIYKAGARVTIIQCDAQINAITEYDGKNWPEIKGRGGTWFDPPVDYYIEHKRDYSALVYFTDGGAPLPKNSPTGMVWVITPNGEHQDYPGQVVYIPKTK